jgi:hypothetical protein
MIDTGGPAFPTLADNGHAMNQDGMTMRDYFAAKAMQSLILAAKTSQDVDLLSKGAYQMADAMLKERSK